MSSKKGKLCGIVLFLLLSGCAHRTPTDRVAIKELTEGIQLATKNLEVSIGQVQGAWEDRLRHITTRERAAFWFPKARKVQAYADSTVAFIDTVRAQFLRFVNGTKARASSVALFFLEQKQGDRLLDSLAAFRNRILNLDTMIRRDLGSPEFIPEPAQQQEDARLAEQYFGDVSPMGADALLQAIVNRVREYEFKVCLLFFHQVGSSRDHYYELPIVGQNSLHLRPGDPLEITAGIGSFNSAPRTTVLINGDTLALNEYGAGVYRARAPRNTGRYLIPVVIDYINTDGYPIRFSKDVVFMIDP